MRHDIVATSDSYPYVTGMGFRNRSHLIFDEFRQDPVDNIMEDGQVVFIKTDLVPMFFENVMPKIRHGVKIITHNSAIGIDLNHLQFLDNRGVEYWYAQNANIRHEKLISIPLGLANKRWEHGNIIDIEKVMKSHTDKQHMVYMNFDIKTNSDERLRVHDLFAEEDFVYSAPKKPFVDYLKDLKSSKFSLSPQGMGVDCHRIWESILVGTIPIVKDCQNISFYKDMPILVVDDWNDVSQTFLEKEYEKIRSDWNDSKLFLDYWSEEIGLKIDGV